MPFRAPQFIGSRTTLQIVRFPVEDRKQYNLVYDNTTSELRMYAVDAEAYPSKLVASIGADPGNDIQPVGPLNDPGSHDGLFARDDHVHGGLTSGSIIHGGMSGDTVFQVSGNYAINNPQIAGLRVSGNMSSQMIDITNMSGDVNYAPLICTSAGDSIWTSGWVCTSGVGSSIVSPASGSVIAQDDGFYRFDFQTTFEFQDDGTPNKGGESVWIPMKNGGIISGVGLKPDVVFGSGRPNGYPLQTVTLAECVYLQSGDYMNIGLSLPNGADNGFFVTKPKIMLSRQR